jgi:hypothetical protein
MQPAEPYEARSGSVIVEGEIAVLSFLTAIHGQQNVSVSMKVHVLETLHARITRALKRRPKPALQAPRR